MTRCNRRFVGATRRAAAWVAGATLVWAVGASAQTTDWDQKVAVREVNQLVKHAAKVKAGIAREYDREDKTSYRYIVLRDVMEIHHLAVNLQSGLRSGQGRDETRHIYDRLQRAIEQAQKDMVQFPAIAAQQADIDRADASLETLSAMYGT